MLLEISGEITSERMEGGMEPKQKQHPVVGVTGDRSKVQCCKGQYCIGTWNVSGRVTGRKARGLQTEEIGCKCQTFLSLLSDMRKQPGDIFVHKNKLKMD